MNVNWGTGNIKDTNITIVKAEASSLLNDIQNNVKDVNFEEKYNVLFTTSKSLFNMIIKDAVKSDFDKKAFYDKLDKMLYYIKKIQDSNITQHNASEKIGEMLASEYIPQCK